MTISPNQKSAVYLVAGSRPWNKEIFRQKIRHYPGEWHFISRPGELTTRRVKKVSPRYIFFLHWSWFIPPEIYEQYPCVVFHMTDLPFGRGGSPLQNLIIRGIYRTKVSAIRVVRELDAGPVYLKRSLDLRRGSAHQLFQKAGLIGAKMIKEIILRQIQPRPQRGRAVIFKRRRPEKSRLPEKLTPRQLYDFIRMLDAPGYPLAFTENSGYRFEFHNAELNQRTLTATVTVRF